jgi:monoamine oxidase
MPRTPLLSSLRRLFLQHHVARLAGVPLPELRAREEERVCSRSVSRRAFVGGIGALAVAAPRRAHAAQVDAPRIAIVGAGIAGLTCALELADRGIRSTIYEASDRVGGRMFSNGRTFDDGQVAEWCGELVDSDNHLIFGLAARFGLPIDDLELGSPLGSEETYHFDGAYYPAARAKTDFDPVCETLLAEISACGNETTRLACTPVARALDAMSVHEWIASRVPGGHRAPLGKLLDVAYAIEFGAESTEQSALNLVYFLGSTRVCRRRPLRLFGLSDEKYHVRGGNQRLPEAIADALDDTVWTGHRLVRIRQMPDGRTELTFASGARLVDVVADVVVLALPFAVLRQLDFDGAGFDEHKTRAIVELGRAKNGKTQLQFRERLWNQRGPWPGRSNGSSYADAGYQNTWDATRAQPGTSGILVFYSGGPVTESMSATAAFGTSAECAVVEDARTALARVEPVFPGLGALWNGRATQSLPHLSDLRGASYSFRRVGQYTAFGGDEGARQGSVFFCGEHTSFRWQGHMEGAAREGLRVAREIAEELGAPEAWPGSLKE